MPDYKAMYYSLAADVATAIELLIKAQQRGEESALQEESPILNICKKEEAKRQ